MSIGREREGEREKERRRERGSEVDKEREREGKASCSRHQRVDSNSYIIKTWGLEDRKSAV